MIHPFKGETPRIDNTCFVAWNAEVAGSVTLGQYVSVWHGASIRGDMAPIFIGDRSNVQDNAVLHVDSSTPLNVGEGVTIGHGAILHGCTIGDGCLIGMGAIVLNNATIGAGSIVGAGSLITSGKEFPARSLVIGSPAKMVRKLTDAEVSSSTENARHYQELIEEYRTHESR